MVMCMATVWTDGIIILGQAIAAVFLPRLFKFGLTGNIIISVGIGLLNWPLRYLVHAHVLSRPRGAAAGGQTAAHSPGERLRAWQAPKTSMHRSQGIGGGGTFGETQPLVLGQQWVDAPPHMPIHTVEGHLDAQKRLHRARFSGVANQFAEDQELVGGIDAERTRKLEGLEAGLRTSRAFR